MSQATRNNWMFTNDNNYNKEETKVQEAPISLIEINNNKRYQDEIEKESQDEINNEMKNKLGERSLKYNLRSRKHPNLPIQYG